MYQPNRRCDNSAENQISKAQPAPQEEVHESNDDEIDDSSGSDQYSESEYESEDEEFDVVETEEDAVYIYHKRLERVEREKQQWRTYKAAMFADLLRSLGSEARALVEASSKFEIAKEGKDPVLLLKICHKKLRHYSSSRGIAKEVRSAKSLYNIDQWPSEHTSDYYQRLVREVEEYEVYHSESVTDRLRAALFTEGLHNARYVGLKVDIENGLLKQKLSLSEAYKQALKYKIRNPDATKSTGILASSFVTTTATASQKKSSEDKQKAKDSNQKSDKDGGKEKDTEKGKKKALKYPCTTCKLLGITSTEHRAHECPNEKRAADMLNESAMQKLNLVRGISGQ